MIKRFMICTMAIFSFIAASAQMPQHLPLNPKIRHGVLENGLNYYLMHNEEPKGRANFYIAQKVGSSLENSEQLGLAHFLEHMAFNGTKNYPGKDMLNYLQSKGLRFGNDINAYTGFDETVYNIDNVPTADKALMDSVLLVLHDWSGYILLEEDEIEAERGVIREEWRMRNDAGTRMYTALLKSVFQEPQYQQMPIGTMDVVMNFPPQALRDYYHKWYRPDQQGIVIVGDFDVDEMEAKVKTLFSEIPMPENAAPREYVSVSDNIEPLYFTFEDPEQTYPMILIAFKFDKIPFEYRDTDMAFFSDILRDITATLINNRLQEYAQKPECKYAQAGTYFGNFYVAATKEAYNIQIIPKGTDMQGALDDAMSIIARACKTGFTQSELQRVIDEMLATYERAYNERDKTNTETLAREICRTFIDNTSNMGIEQEYEIMKMALPTLPVEEINALASQLLTPQNQVIVVAQPQQDGWQLPAKDVIIGGLENSLNAEYEAYVDEVITEPLIAKLPKKGKITATNQGAFETTEFTLSNGVKVIVKPTDFSSDQILFTAVKRGGKETYSADQAANLDLLDAAFEVSKLGPFDVNMLKKYLAGKKVALGINMGDRSLRFEGSSTVKDLPTLMELLYTAFTNVNPDVDTYNSTLDIYRTILANQDKDPSTIFTRAVTNTRFGNNPMKAPTSLETLDKASYPKMLDIMRTQTANAADYTFMFIGNVDVETLKPLLEQYVATLPSKKKAEVAPVVTPILIADGIVENFFEYPMDTPSTQIFQNYNGTLPVNNHNITCISLLGNILSNVFTRTLREEEGGAYSPYAYGYFDYFKNRWNIITSIQTNAEQQARMIERAGEEFNKLLSEGADADDFNKVKNAALNQYDQNVKTNDYWNNSLRAYILGHDIISEERQSIADLTLEDFNAFLKNLYDGKNFIEVVMTGVAK